MNDQDPKADCPRARTMRYIKAHAANIAHDVGAAKLSLRSGTAKTVSLRGEGLNGWLRSS